MVGSCQGFLAILPACFSAACGQRRRGRRCARLACSSAACLQVLVGGVLQGLALGVAADRALPAVEAVALDADGVGAADVRGPAAVSRCSAVALGAPTALSGAGAMAGAGRRPARERERAGDGAEAIGSPVSGVAARALRRGAAACRPLDPASAERRQDGAVARTALPVVRHESGIPRSAGRRMPRRNSNGRVTRRVEIECDRPAVHSPAGGNASGVTPWTGLAGWRCTCATVTVGEGVG